MRTILCLSMLLSFFIVDAQTSPLAHQASYSENGSNASEQSELNTGFLLRTEENKPIMLTNDSPYEFLYARFLGEGEATVRVRNAYGKTVKEFKVKLTGITNSKINISQLPMGKYFLQLSYKNKRFIHPFVKLRAEKSQQGS